MTEEDAPFPLVDDPDPHFKVVQYDDGWHVIGPGSENPEDYRFVCMCASKWIAENVADAMSKAYPPGEDWT